jgi:hypothetical protein
VDAKQKGKVLFFYQFLKNFHHIIIIVKGKKLHQELKQFVFN